MGRERRKEKGNWSLINEFRKSVVIFIGEYSRALVELICSDIDPAVREGTNLRFQGERE